MRKIFLSISLIFFFAGAVSAQDSDSTTVKKTEPEIIQKKDSIKTEPEPIVAPSQDSIQGLPEVVPPLSTESRIIYYQDSKPDYKTKKNDIKTLSGSMNHSGGFFGFSFRGSEFRDETAVMAGFRTGWIINRTLAMGFEGHGIIPTAKFSDLDPNKDFVLLGGYGGMFLEFIAFSNQVIHVTFPVAGGAGWLGYHEDWEDKRLNDPSTNTTGALIDQDVFWYLEPGASIEMNLSRNFRMAFGLSKRLTDDFQLINTDGSDFENMNFFVTLKLGKF